MRSSIFKHQRLRSLSVIALTFVLVLCSLSFASAQTLHEQEVSRAEGLIDSQEVEQALNLYREILQRYEQRPRSEISEPELGKLHLRLAQVYLKRAQIESNGDMMLLYESSAAYHFWRCSRIAGLDSLLRDDICRREVGDRMAPLQVRGPFQRLFVSHPEAFRGDVVPGAWLPKGRVVLQVTLKQGDSKQYMLNLPQERPLELETPSLTVQPPRLSQRNTAGLILRPEGSDLVMNKTKSNGGSQSKRTIHQVPVVPGYIMAGAGVATLIASSLIYFDVIDPEAGRDRTLNWTLISGASLVVVGGGWIAFTW